MVSKIHSYWSDIPVEIAHEIAGHNADDVETLRAMALVSKTTRSVAITHIFSRIYFACVEDFSRWLDMLSRTPMLNSVVKKVIFTNRNMDKLRRREIGSVTELQSFTSPPVIPPLPSVHSVELDSIHLTYGPPSGMVVAHMALFPNIKHLWIGNLQFNLAVLTNVLGACKQLKTLSFTFLYNLETDSGGGSDPTSAPRAQFRRVPFDLTTLEELVIVDCAYDTSEAVFSLTQHSQPTRLKILSLGDSSRNAPCPLQRAEELLRFSAASLVNLVVDPKFPDTDTRKLASMLERLPAFMALESLTLWIGPYDSAATFINGFTAPNLTKLIFRGVLDRAHARTARNDLEDFFREPLSWVTSTSESMGTFFTRKFPRCQPIEFHFCNPHDSEIHFRRGLRRRTERRLKACLQESGADIAEMRVEWLDEEYYSVKYNKTNGKPPWKWGSSHKEPESEASDCESDSDDPDQY